jgi:hypothetical protein
VNSRFALFASALALATMGSLVNSKTADANHIHFSGGGHVRIGGGGGFHARVGGSFGWSRPAYQPYYGRSWGVGGRIYVGPSYGYGYRYYGWYPRYYYYYTPVPSYYGYYTQPYYPVAPAPAVATNTVVAPPAPPQLPKLGIGLFAGGASNNNDTAGTNDSSDVGLLGRLRLGNGGLLVEAEIGKASFKNDERVDRRIGGSLVYEIGAYNKLAPYVLAGVGVQQADVAGTYQTTQDYGEIGIGLRWAVSPNFHLLFDVRAGERKNAGNSNDVPMTDTAARSVTPPTNDANSNTEDYTRARLAAVLYF